MIISWPRIAEGLSEMIAEFPFYAILLVFGTEVNATYHMGRRMYQQVASPLVRGYNVDPNVLVEQSFGRGEPEEACYDRDVLFCLSSPTSSASPPGTGFAWRISL